MRCTYAVYPRFDRPPLFDEVGWFLYHEKYGREQFGGPYDEERLAYSRLLRDEVLSYCGQDEQWLRDKTVVTIGCGCTGPGCLARSGQDRR